MSESTESPNQNLQNLDHFPPPPPPPEIPLSAAAMAETEQPPPSQSDTKRYSNISFSVWPPTERTREAVRNRLIENLSSPSILTKRYGTISREEAVDATKIIEEAAFEAAGNAATTGDDGIEILQFYSKEISKRMLDTVKARSGGGDAGVATAPIKPEEEDASSTAPPQSEKTESVADDE